MSSFQDKFPNLTTVEIDSSKYNDILNLYSKEHSISDTMEYGIELAMGDLMEEVSKQVEEYCLDKQRVREVLMEWFYTGTQLDTIGKHIWEELGL